MICEEVKNPKNKYEAASTLLGSERPFGQVHLLWQIFGLEEEDNGESESSKSKETDDEEETESDGDDDDASNES